MNQCSYIFKKGVYKGQQCTTTTCNEFCSIHSKNRQEYQKEYGKKRNKIYYENNKEKIKAAAKIYRENNKEVIKNTHHQYYENNKEKIKERINNYKYENWDKTLLFNCKSHDERNNKQFDLNEEWIQVMLKYQGGLCAICGDEMLLINGDRCSKQISIDRINNSLGHLKDNCCLTCWDCNNKKRGKSYEEFGCYIDCIPKYEECY